MDTIDVVPSMGDEFEIEGYRFKIQAMRRRRISTIRVSRIEAPAADEADPSDEGASSDEAPAKDAE